MPRFGRFLASGPPNLSYNLSVKPMMCGNAQVAKTIMYIKMKILNWLVHLLLCVNTILKYKRPNTTRPRERPKSSCHFHKLSYDTLTRHFPSSSHRISPLFSLQLPLFSSPHLPCIPHHPPSPKIPHSCFRYSSSSFWQGDRSVRVGEQVRRCGWRRCSLRTRVVSTSD